MNGYMKPQDIEKRSFEIITAELGERTFPAGIAEVVKRVIHTTADFDYADSLAFSPDVIEKAKAALAAGATVVTDTNMALSGVSKATLAKLGGKAVCLMADEQVASEVSRGRSFRWSTPPNLKARSSSPSAMRRPRSSVCMS